MTALVADVKTRVRGGPNFGYPVAPNTKIYAGALCALNAAGQLLRPEDAGAVAFAGVADRQLDNSTSAVVSPGYVVPQRGIVVQINVPLATPANIGAAVYATDDATLTLTNTGALLTVGYLSGIENGLTWIKVVS